MGPKLTLTYIQPLMMHCRRKCLGRLVTLITIISALQGILVLMDMFTINGMSGTSLCIISIMDKEVLHFTSQCQHLNSMDRCIIVVCRYLFISKLMLFT